MRLQSARDPGRADNGPVFRCSSCPEGAEPPQAFGANLLAAESRVSLSAE